MYTKRNKRERERQRHTRVSNTIYTKGRRMYAFVDACLIIFVNLEISVVRKKRIMETLGVNNGGVLLCVMRNSGC